MNQNSIPVMVSGSQPVDGKNYSYHIRRNGVQDDEILEMCAACVAEFLLYGMCHVITFHRKGN